jgi:glycosyltransferase involved in cell wall biosynthesis
MLSVCVATTSFPRWKDDFKGTFIWESCRALSALGVHVLVVAPHAAGAKAHEDISGIEVFRPRYLLPVRWELLLATPGGLPALWDAGGLGRLTVLPFLAAHTLAVARLARGSDLIHAHWTLSAFSAWAGRGIHRRPWVCTVQGSDVYQAMRIPAAGFVARKSLRGARRVIALSASLADTTAAQGVPADAITVIPNGVDPACFSPNGNPREPTVLFAGSLVERKGARYLIRAMQEIHRRHPEYQLHLIGDGPQKKELADLARALGLEARIRFLGSLPPAEVARRMRRATVFVLPSLEEGQGVAALEALASGTPCVASRVGGIPEMLANGSGELAEPGDVSSLERAILATIDDLPRRELAARDAVAQIRRRYGWNTIGRRILAVYQEVLAQTESGPERVGKSGQV